MSFRIVKRDKELEDFNEAKIVNVLEASGLNHEEAQNICKIVFQWAEDTKKPLITTLQIRDRIITELQKTNREAAEHYVEYELKRDKTIGGPNS
jgi:transcriptional regulator NrdR family protein